MRASLTPLLLALLPAAPLAAQSNGVTLLSKVKSYPWYSSIWGYTAPNGDEYALVGTGSGTAIYNCVDPRAPYLTAFIAGPASLWREMKTWDHYAYIVTEGGGGFQIVDMANPEAPRLVKTWGDWIWGNAHTISVDLGTGYAYMNGTNRGMVVADLSRAPENPTWIATYTGPYVHDCHVQHSLAHLAQIYDGNYRIVSVANLPSMPTLDVIRTPGAFTHNAWASADDRLCVTTDESSGGMIALYDISNPYDIRLKDTFTINPQSTVHNAYILGNRVYIAWYTEGFVCADISNPSDIQLVGSYDTSPYGPGTGYHGAWGCYPFSPSGVVYISDIEEGFHVLRVDGAAFDMQHAPLANTEDENGPYAVTATVAALNPGATVADVAAFYRVDGGSWQSAALAPTGNPDEWSGGMPGQNAPAMVEYYLLAHDSQGRTGWLPEGSAPGDNLFSFAVGRIVSLYFNDFEGTTDEGWTHGRSSGVDDWERGAPQGKSGNSSRHQGVPWRDPDAAYSGAKCWANDLGAGSADGQYEPTSSNWLLSPPLDCTTSTRTTLLFQRWLSVEAAPYDWARIVVNGVTVWQNPMGSTGPMHTTDASWRQQLVDLSAVADGQPAVTVRFELQSDNLLELGGWALDDVRVVSLQDVPGVNTILLTGPASVPVGGQATYDYAAAPPSSPWWLYGSLNQNGTTINGHPFDIGVPYRSLATGTTAAGGAGSWTSRPAPPRAAGRTVYVEMRVDSGGETYDSNVVATLVQ